MEQHRLLTTKQITRYLQAKEPYHTDSVLRRLRKFTKYKILIKYQHTFAVRGFNFSFNYYRLGKKGAEILVSEGYLPVDFNTGSVALAKKGNPIHYLAAQEIVSHTLEKNHNKFAIESINPFYTKYFDSDYPQKSKLLVSPDWILKKDNMYINLEIDNNTETLGVLEEKVSRYLKLNKQDQNKHTVMICFVDESFHTTKRPQKRIKNLKNKLLKGEISANLNCLILPLERSYSRPYQLMNDLPFDSSNRRMYMEEVLLETLKRQSKVHYPFECDQLADEEQILSYIEKEYGARPDLLYKEITAQGVRIYRMGMMMREGDIYCLYKLKLFSRLINENSFLDHLGIKIAGMYACYSTKDELLHDILGDPLPFVEFTALEEISSWNNPPKFYTYNANKEMEGFVYERKVKT
ncbi:replication-relaxation family protein [Fictibacillus sp. KIGAM418]|uniref:Replication-relaxation family protein n=1 Tax=Fictibacillus marinisediminis TaxID=2878389 RepID=A0A9X1XF61_9BACL|nr:replication-relaxation family protein [Fictibacillus marinisediminis]MCK6259551.1 replication-relaxation family protein [Fictibacillus marinisediminis]